MTSCLAKTIQGVNGGVVPWENLMELLLDFAMVDDTGTVFQLWGSLKIRGILPLEMATLITESLENVHKEESPNRVGAHHCHSSKGLLDQVNVSRINWSIHLLPSVQMKDSKNYTLRMV